MTYIVTLEALRQHEACLDGYNKLVCHLKGEPYTFHHKHLEGGVDPIPVATILESNGVEDAIWSLRALKHTPEMVRDCQLFADACLQQIQHRRSNPRALTVIEAAKRHGVATAWCVARVAASAARAVAHASGCAPWTAAWDAAHNEALDEQAVLFKKFFCRELLNNK